jgi:hypothetical protein
MASITFALGMISIAVIVAFALAGPRILNTPLI